MRLNLRQQRALHEVIDAAQRRGGTHTKRHGALIFTARSSGLELEFSRIYWRVTDADGTILKEGES